MIKQHREKQKELKRTKEEMREEISKSRAEMDNITHKYSQVIRTHNQSE